MQRGENVSVRKSESDLDCSLENKFGLKMLNKNEENPFGGMFRNLWNEPNNYQLHKPKKNYYAEELNSSRSNMQTAGMRVFATVILNAWRKRKQDVKDLTVKVVELKRASMKTKNQIHVFNTLFRVEQKRNDELNGQIRRSMENINQAKSSCESLTTTIISLKADRALLEEQLRMKLKELEGLNELLSQTKTDLFRSLVEQRNLQYSLCKEQRNVQFLENHKNKLINEICDLNTENRQIQEKYANEVSKKEQELNNVNKKLKNIEQLLIEKKEKAFKLIEFTDSDAKLSKELAQLRLRAMELRKELDKSISNRIKLLWQQLCNYQRISLRLAHWLTYYLLPATPQPQLSFTNSLMF